MAEFTPTRSLAITLADERRTMREGYAFLDEKCVLLAGEMLRQLQRWQRQQALWRQALAQARAALRAAVARHGLHGLQTYPPVAPTTQSQPLQRTPRSLLGVALQSAVWGSASAASPVRVAAEAPLQPSPEALACAQAYAALLPATAELAALSGNLARLYAEYRRTVRRVRALQDVLLPEADRTLREIEASLEELEQDEAAVLRRVAQPHD